MNTVRSADGTRIAYDKVGSGKPVILVDGALCSREMGGSPKIAALLADHFTAYAYDRRGRNESSDTSEPYAVEREVEDIAALIEESGGAASLFGISSGAALILEAAKALPGVEKLFLYEPPFIVDDTREPVPADTVPRMYELVRADRRADAVKMFLRLVGMPSPLVALMPLMPAWKKLKAVAHTLPYDLTIIADHQRGEPLPAGEWDAVTVPTVVMAGTKSPAWMQNASRALAGVLPDAQFRLLEGQTHMVKPKVLAPELIEWFSDGARELEHSPRGSRVA
jgi:pimeloyl-ACP methyl ester carboxylesterase